MKEILEKSIFFFIDEPKDIFQISKETDHAFINQQLDKDILDQLKMHDSLNHQDFAHILKKYLDEKYDTLIWGVHIFNPAKRPNNYEVTGFYKGVFDVQNRNVVVSFGPKRVPEKEKLENVKKLMEKYKKDNYFFSLENSSELIFDAGNVISNIKKCPEVKDSTMIQWSKLRIWKIQLLETYYIENLTTRFTATLSQIR